MIDYDSIHTCIYDQLLMITQVVDQRRYNRPSSPKEFIHDNAKLSLEIETQSFTGTLNNM